MSHSLKLIALVCALVGCSQNATVKNSEQSSENDARPNIMFILTDDQGYADLGAYGAVDLRTPSIDAIANRGIKFTQFYAGAPICSPSRASLLTGQTPTRAGVPSNGSANSAYDGMPSEEITLAEALKANNYRTGLVGKWHLGSSPEKLPGNQGFDFSFGHINGCIDNYSHTYYWEEPYRHDLQLNGQEVRRDGLYFPDLMVLEAKRFIDQSADRPFFLYVAMNMPHYPYQGDAEWLQYYESQGLVSPRKEYAAFVSTLDTRIGQLIEHLRDSGKLENTIIIFQSDHGFSTESRAMGGGGSAGIYRGAKFSLFEGGIRIPAIISYPDHLQVGVERDQIAVAADWFPTILELAGIPSKGYDFDGSSLVPILADPALESLHETYVWQWNGAQAIRQGRWKLLIDPRDTSTSATAPAMKGDFLYDLESDPSETMNVAGLHADIVAALKQSGADLINAQEKKEACANHGAPIRYEFATNRDEIVKLLGVGWHQAEPNLVWSTSKAELLLPMPAECQKGGCVATISGSAVGGPESLSSIGLSTLVDDQLVTFGYDGVSSIEIPLSSGCAVKLTINVERPTIPKEAGINSDVRSLGLALQSLEIVGP